MRYKRKSEVRSDLDLSLDVTWCNVFRNDIFTQPVWRQIECYVHVSKAVHGLSLLNKSPLLCVEWCYIELLPKKSLASANITHFCKNRLKNSQILSFWWNGYHFWIKLHYCASNGATLNSFLKKVWPLQKSAIFAKISPKTARFWFFHSRMTILLTK